MITILIYFIKIKSADDSWIHISLPVQVSANFSGIAMRPVLRLFR